MNKKPTIAIIGGTVWGNRGAEAMLVTVIGRIRQDFPDAHFNIFSYYLKKDRTLVSDPHIHFYDGSPLSLVANHFLGVIVLKALSFLRIKPKHSRFLKTANALAQSDVLLDIGGITFSDGREKFLPFNILTIWPTMLVGTPVIKLAQAVGPFDHTLNRILAKYFLSRCAHVFLRGKNSTQHISRLNLPSDKTSSAPDIAFLYDPRYSLSNENAQKAYSIVGQIRREQEFGKQIIVIAPSILVDKKLRKKGLDYTDLLLSALGDRNPEKFFFVFMPNATREGSPKQHNNDILMIDKIMQRLKGSNLPEAFQNTCAYIDFDINTQAIRQVISHADLLITSRYHAMISGLALSVPTIVIGWSHKYQETMASFGLSDYALSISEINRDLSPAINEALEQSPHIQARIKDHLPLVREQADSQFRNIRQYFR